jgi:hypothetical protein
LSQSSLRLYLASSSLSLRVSAIVMIIHKEIDSACRVLR